MQFKKFARFEPRNKPLDDTSLAARVRDVTRQPAWAEPLPENQRIVFPGYKDLKEMSKARRELVQLNIGHAEKQKRQRDGDRCAFAQQKSRADYAFG